MRARGLRSPPERGGGRREQEENAMGNRQRRIVRGLATLGALVAALAAGAGAPSVVGVAVRAPALAAALTGPVAPRLACAALAQPEPVDGVPDFGGIPGAPTRVTSASVVAATASAPEFCDVKGYVAPQIQFELKLPTKTWQGRYLQNGCGGFCGAIGQTRFPSCDLQPGGDFAVSATDDGHMAPGFDAVWAATDEQVRADFGSRAVHVVAAASKAIIQAFYGTAPQRSYFMGCSDGGREGLMEAQRFPADFDGIVAGAPANIWAPLNGEFQVWLARINLDAQGNPILTVPADPTAPNKLAALHAAALASCDGADGHGPANLPHPRSSGGRPEGVPRPGRRPGPASLPGRRAGRL